jgi:spore germination protein YaaH/flagellar hook assembly protein FlgD
MTSRTGAPGRASRALAAALAVVVLGGLPATATAADPAAVPAVDLRPYRVSPGDEPSQMYLDTIANESREYAFTPGGRVTVGFEPRADDRWPVDGGAPRSLPAGRESGAEMAGVTADAGSSTPDPGSSGPAPAAETAPVESAPPPATPGASGTVPAPTVEPDSSPTPIPAEGAAFVVPADPAELAPAAVGMRRGVYGFLPYWEVADSSTRLDFRIITHLSYFSVGADSKGNLKKRRSNGSLTTGWAGWTSSKMTSIINAAHAKRSRVTLTLSVFAWTSSQAAVQKALLGSAAARGNLARQAVAAVRSRGADGINLDFEPLVSGYEDEFVALVRTIRAELRRVRSGYHLSFDSLGYPGNYPLEGALARGGADAVFVMGYDYRTAGSHYAGSIDPLAGPAYDLVDTVRAYTARVAASKVILGIPYYGRAWSTVSDARNARTQTGAKYGYSSAVNYDSAVRYAAEHGRRYDSREVAAWTAYKRKSCTAAGGCVTTWRQIYYDDASTLKARYDLVNRAGLRGTGIWALGYDGQRRELYQALADKFLHDTTAPQAGIVAFGGGARRDEGFVVRWTAADDWSGIASYDVEVSADGRAWTPWLRATKATSATYLGVDNHGYAFRVRARDGKGNLSGWRVTSVFAADPSLSRGGFLRVTSDTLNMRSAPDTSATRVATASAGDLLAITGGPATADGYTWFEVSGPIETWAPVGDVQTSVWIAARGNGVTNVVAARAPNAALVGAGIRQVGFSGRGSSSLGTSTAAVAARSFSPNKDGSGDTLAIRWNNRSAFDALELRVLRPNGTLLGTRPLAATGDGWQEHAWDGRAGGTMLADGSYVLQLVGTRAGTRYHWPAEAPEQNGIPPRVAVRIDRVPPTLLSATASGTRLSPNADGKYESMAISGKGSADTIRWDVVMAPRVGSTYGSPVRRIAGTGRSATATWKGTADGGARVPDGTYRVTLRFFDAAGNAATRSWTATVDATPPRLAVSAKPAAFSPDRDGTADTVRLAWSSSEKARGTLRLLRGTTVVRSWAVSGTSGGLTWNGRDAAGRIVRDGRLAVSLSAADALANGARATSPVVVDRTAGWLRWSPSAFFPQDGDRLSTKATVSVRVARPARLTLRILDASGREVRRPWASRRIDAGTASWRWDGRTGTGAWAPQGRYVAELTAVGSLGTTVLKQAVYAGAFRATPSTTSPRAGTRFSVEFRSVEPLAGAPTATFRQAGRNAVPMKVVRLADGSWRASVAVSSGAPGPAVVSLRARDAGGGLNKATVTVRIP